MHLRYTSYHTFKWKKFDRIRITSFSFVKSVWISAEWKDFKSLFLALSRLNDNIYFVKTPNYVVDDNLFYTNQHTGPFLFESQTKKETTARDFWKVHTVSLWPSLFKFTQFTQIYIK